MPKNPGDALAACLAASAGVSQKAALQSLSPPQGNFGDISSTIAFELAKKKKANPAQIAAGIAEKINAALPEGIKEAKAAGPYLNFFYSDGKWREILISLQDEDFGRGAKKKGKALVESPSVNPNKPWHVGHLRNALLGDSLARIMEFSGIEVEREDYIDDLGLQVAQSVWGTRNLPKPEKEKFDHLLGKQYVEVAKRLAEPQVEAEVRQIIKELEEGSGHLANAARATVEKCVAAQYETAFAYGIYHDVLIFESDIVRTIFTEGINRLKATGALRLETEGKNAGCYVVPLSGAKGFEGMESPDKILLRSDGTATYTGKDAVFQLWKFGKLSGQFRFVPFLKQPNGKIAYMTSKLGPAMRFGGASKVINVICQDQAYPQKVLKVVLERLGYKGESENSIHLAYELVSRKEGKFSGREGTWMAREGELGFTADELLAEGARRALEKIKGELGEEEKAQIAKAVAIGAIRFSFLRMGAEKKIIFDWDSALSFEGDSGPYMQYSYARACRIIEKAGEQGGAIKAPGEEVAGIYQFNNEEKAMLSHMLRFSYAVEKCSSSHQVHPMAEYALELAGRFSRFYSTTPVLADGVKPGQRAVRLAEVAALLGVLGSAITLLGIPKVGRM